jgi:hypothetical protein
MHHPDQSNVRGAFVTALTLELGPDAEGVPHYKVADVTDTVRAVEHVLDALQLEVVPKNAVGYLPTTTERVGTGIGHYHYHLDEGMSARDMGVHLTESHAEDVISAGHNVDGFWVLWRYLTLDAISKIQEGRT